MPLNFGTSIDFFEINFESSRHQKAHDPAENQVGIQSETIVIDKIFTIGEP